MPERAPTQLYSVEKKVSQPLSSHAGAFTTAKVAGRDDPAILFCFVEKKPDTPFRLMVRARVCCDRACCGGPGW